MMKRKKLSSLLLTLSLLLTVIPLPVAKAASSISSGEYYINNKSTGYYLGRAITMQGKLSSIKNSINWHINMVDSTWCTLSPASAAPVYLNYDQSTNKINFSNGSVVQDECLWNFTLTSNGILIKNKATSMYLYSSGTSLYLSSTKYASSYWRTVSTEKYGATSAFSYRELSNFATGTIFAELGVNKTISITRYPLNVTKILWAENTDFIYTIPTSGSNIISVSSTGTITGLQLGTTTLTITHKPTGIKYTANVTVSVDASLLGIADDGHDHETSLSESVSTLKNSNIGYDSINLKLGTSFSNKDVQKMLDYSSFFISRSHGGYNTTTNTSYIVLSNTSVLEGTDLYDWTNNISKFDLSNLKICVFVGCLTDSGFVNHSLARSAKYAGAKASVGFDEEITCEYSNKWTISLIEELANGTNIEDACYNALHNGYYLINIANGIDSYYIYGNEEQTL